MEARSYDADGRFNAMLAGLNSTEVLKGGDETDHSMAAHSEKTNVIEEDYSCGAIGLTGRDDHCADEDIGTARFVHDGGTKAIMLLAEGFGLSGN